MSQPNDEKFFWRKDFREESFPSDEESSDVTTAGNLVQQQRTVSPIVNSSTSRSNDSKLSRETKLVIGIPAHNSEKSIARTVVGLLSLNVDIIVCDDFSTDTTEKIARELGCKLIKHPRELGLSDSITSLFLASRRLHANNLLTVDTEMDFTLRDALNLLEKVQSGECDIAIGSNRSGDERSEDETIDHVRDPYSLFRAYGKRALALIAPAGTTSVVMESDVLDFAIQQGLKVREYSISSAGIPWENLSSRNWFSRLKALPTKIEKTLSRTVATVVLDHPLLFLGTPAIGMLAASAVQGIDTFQLWSATGLIPDYGFYYAGFDLVIALILGVGALILESTNRSKVRRR